MFQLFTMSTFYCSTVVLVVTQVFNTKSTHLFIFSVMDTQLQTSVLLAHSMGAVGLSCVLLLIVSLFNACVQVSLSLYVCLCAIIRLASLPNALVEL